MVLKKQLRRKGRRRSLRMSAKEQFIAQYVKILSLSSQKMWKGGFNVTLALAGATSHALGWMQNLKMKSSFVGFV